MNKEDLINQYIKEILISNKIINLTRITDLNQAYIFHIEDSLSALKELNEAPEGLYGDLGSGGGFPGVPLAIQTGRKTILIDSIKKKMKVVSEILTTLGLSNQISVIDKRIEELSHEYSEDFSVLTARALTSLPSLLELAAPLLKKKGQLICLKSHIEDKEYKQTQTISYTVGMRCISDRDFYLSDNTTYRRILVFEKYKDPEIKLPRRIGMAQKRPLKE